MKVTIISKKEFDALAEKHTDSGEYAFVLLTPTNKGPYFKNRPNYFKYKLANVEKKTWKKEQWSTYRYMAQIAKIHIVKNVYICDLTPNRIAASTLAKVFCVVNPNCEVIGSTKIHLPTFHSIVKLLSYNAIDIDEARKNPARLTYKHLVTIVGDRGQEHNFIYNDRNNDIADVMLKTPLLDFKVSRLSEWELERLEELDVVRGHQRLAKYVKAVMY